MPKIKHLLSKNAERESLCIWYAIDTIAERNGKTPAGLAVACGLNPTTFNKSKRVAADGSPRFPSTQTLLAIFRTVGMTWNDWARTVQNIENLGACA